MSRIGNAKIVMIKAGGGGMPADPLPIENGGTGNTVGYIQTGLSSGEYAGTSTTVEGEDNYARGDYSHVEGYNNIVRGDYSHAEGQNNEVNGDESHVEGIGNSITGNYSHASGSGNICSYDNQTVVGKYNDNKSGTLFEVGSGSSSQRNNAFEVYSDGKFSQDNGSTKFKFGNNGTSDGYYDASGTFHSFTSGSSTLSGLTDTNISSPLNGQLLKYNSSSAKWVNGSADLDGLSDTYISSPSNGQVLQYDGTRNKWVNGSASSGTTISTTDYAILSDNWSASQNASGYYTYQLSLNPQLNTSFSPKVYFYDDLDDAGYDTKKAAYNLLSGCNLSSPSTLTLYAKSKPTTLFYIIVEGANA